MNMETQRRVDSDTKVFMRGDELYLLALEIITIQRAQGIPGNPTPQEPQTYTFWNIEG